MAQGMTGKFAPSEWRFDGTYRAAEAPDRSYFAAANTSRGFVGWFEELISAGCTRRMIIKGGPGTGKSHMLYRMADTASAAGAAVEYYFCSSDPESLDGIAAIFPDGRVYGVQDGTAPHAAEASLPGARDELFDLGACWDSSRLRAARSRIEELGAEKSRAWGRAFSCLASAGGLRRAALELAAGLTDRERAERTAARMAGEARRSMNGNESENRASDASPVRHVLRSPHRSLGMRGAVMLGGIYHGARDVYLMSDEPFPGAGILFVTAVAAEVERSGTSCRISPDPLLPELCAAVRIGDVVYTADRKPRLGAGAVLHRVGLRRFGGSTGSARAEYLRLSALADSAVTAALAAMSDAARAHFALEEIYMNTMDFERKEAAEREAAAEFFAEYL